MPSCLLEDRGLVRVAGEDARSFLQGVLTCNMDKVSPGAAAFGALLSPQGKILFDFILFQQGESFLLDCFRPKAADFAKRLGMYRLRAKVTIEDVSDVHGVAALWNGEKPADPALVVETDPRNPGLGWRLAGPLQTLVPFADTGGDSAYEGLRIGLGVPKGGVDFAYGETFPHEANMDLLHGLDFRKGCYVGQEVVSRVEHRGLARKRICRIEHAGQKATQGARILAGEKEIGEVGSGILGLSLAMLRLDRLEEARTAGLEIRIENGPVVDAVIPPG